MNSYDKLVELSEEVKLLVEDKNKYRKAYLILMEYWESLLDEDKLEIHARLKNIGL